MDMQLLNLVLTAAGLIALGVALFKIHIVHTLVNSRLSTALDEKEDALAEVERLGGATAPPVRGPDDK